MACHALVGHAAVHADASHRFHEPRRDAPAQRRAQEVQALDGLGVEVVAVNMRQQDEPQSLAVWFEFPKWNAAVNEYFIIQRTAFPLEPVEMTLTLQIIHAHLLGGAALSVVQRTEGVSGSGRSSLTSPVSRPLRRSGDQNTARGSRVPLSVRYTHYAAHDALRRERFGLAADVLFKALHRYAEVILERLSHLAYAVDHGFIALSHHRLGTRRKSGVYHVAGDNAKNARAHTARALIGDHFIDVARSVRATLPFLV